MTGWLMAIPGDLKDMADYIDAVRVIAGTAREGSKAIALWIGPEIVVNVKKLFGRAEELRAAIPPERQTDPSPSVVAPLIEAAMVESREELQELWAALLASAMIDKGKKVRRAFIEALRSLEPADVRLLNVLEEMGDTPPSLQLLDRSRQVAELSQDTWDVSIIALSKLTLIAPSYTGAHVLSAMGRELMAALKVK